MESTVIDIYKQLGGLISFELADTKREEFVAIHTPKELKFMSLLNCFKKDIIINHIVEHIKQADIFYIENNNGRSDELYYLCVNNCLYHGEKVWSQYHPFITKIKEIPVTESISESCWFIGTRPNYTHQVLDFLPNLLLLARNKENWGAKNDALVIGKNNSILESCKEFSSVINEFSARRVYKMSELGEAITMDHWKIRRIRFKNLKYVRFLSIFESSKLLEQEAEGIRNNINDAIIGNPKEKELIYLQRNDNRVLNQSSIQRMLVDEFESDCIGNLDRLSFYEKIRLLSSYKKILMPPGSENINGLCFGNKEAKLFQMINCRVEDYIVNPFNGLCWV